MHAIAAPRSRLEPRRAPWPHRRRLLGLSAVLAACLLLASPGAADLLLTTETREPSGDTETLRRGRIWLAPDRIRMEFGDDATGVTATVIFRADRELYWALDPAHERYLQIDRETMARLGDRVRTTRREIGEKLEQMAPEDRRRAEAMLADLLPPASTPARESLRATGTHESVAGLDTQRSELLQNGRVVGEVFAAPYAAVGISRQQLDVFSALAAFQHDLMQSLGGAAGAMFGAEPFEIFEQLDGFPLLIRRLHEGAIQSETRFGPPEHTSAQDGRYAPPAGYVRRVDSGSGP